MEPTQTNRNESEKPLALNFDIKAYLGQLDDWDITDEQKHEMLGILWNLLYSCAQIGLGVHPVQLLEIEATQRINKNNTESPENAALSGRDVLYSAPYNRTQINDLSEAFTATEESEDT